MLKLLTEYVTNPLINSIKCVHSPGDVISITNCTISGRNMCDLTQRIHLKLYSDDTNLYFIYSTDEHKSAALGVEVSKQNSIQHVHRTRANIAVKRKL